MVDVRQKGSTAETKAKEELIKLTNEDWQRIPMSGALDAKHGLKGDLYIVGKHNLYCVEVKHYSSSHIDYSLITGKNPQILEWVEQAKRQSIQVGKKWLLIFKHDRSKFFVAFEELPEGDYPFIFISKNGHELYISLLSDFIINNNPRFV